MIQTDICIIGAGPVGLFAVFEAGLLKLRLPFGGCPSLKWADSFLRFIRKSLSMISLVFPTVKSTGIGR